MSERFEIRVTVYRDLLPSMWGKPQLSETLEEIRKTEEETKSIHFVKGYAGAYKAKARETA